MLKPFKTITKAFKPNFGVTLSNRISSKYSSFSVNGKGIVSAYIDVDIVHKDSPNANRKDYYEIILAILNLLLQKSSFLMNNKPNKVVSFNTDATLDYYLSILRFYNNKDYHAIERMYSNFNELQSTFNGTSENVKALENFYSNLQSMVSSYSNEFKNSVKLNGNFVRNRASKMLAINESVQLNTVNLPFFQMLNNKSVKYLFKDNKQFFEFATKIAKDSQEKKNLKIKDRLVQTIYVSPQEQIDYFWNAIKNSDIYNRDVVSMLVDTNTPAKESLAFLLNGSTNDQFVEFVKVLKREVSAIQNTEKLDMNGKLKNEVRSLLSFSFVNSKNSLMSVFNTLTQDRQAEILRYLGIESLNILLENTAINGYSDVIEKFKNYQEFDSWAKNNDNTRLMEYYNLLNNQTLKHEIESTFSVHYDTFVRTLLNSTAFSNYADETHSIENVLKSYVESVRSNDSNHIVSSLVQKKSAIESILDKVVNRSYTLESLNEAEITQVRALVSNTELTNVTHVVESLESLSESETAHLLDFINTIHLENTRKTSRDVEQIFTEKLMDKAFESASFKRVDRTIAKLKNISILDDTTINRISKFERHARPLKVLVVEDFPNYLRETPLQYYTLIPHANVVNATNVTNQLRATTQSTMSHKVDTVTNNENQQRDENIDSLLRKVEEQSRKIERLEKTSSTDSSYRLSQSDINAITDDLLYKLENQSSIENFRKGIF
jgi:hypothetical protein